MSSTGATGKTSILGDSSLPPFNTPGRSIFSSGPPTSSLSANTAQASMTSRSSNLSPHPLSALTASASASRTGLRNRQTGFLTPHRMSTVGRGNDDYSEAAIITSADQGSSASRSSPPCQTTETDDSARSDFVPYMRRPGNRQSMKG